MMDRAQHALPPLHWRDDLGAQGAKTEAEGLIRNAERQIQLETQRALQQIRQESVELSVLIASKILRRTLTKEDNEKLIEEALKQVEIPRH